MNLGRPPGEGNYDANVSKMESVFVFRASDVTYVHIILQKRIIRVILKKDRFERSFPLFLNLRLLPLRHLYIYKVLRCFYNRSGNSGIFLCLPSPITLRQNSIPLPKPNLTLFKRCFLYVGPKVFNILPKHCIGSKSVKSFLGNTRTWLFTKESVEQMLL
jgi:hypothetical protein